MSDWQYRFHVIIPAALAEAANAQAATIDPDSGGAYTFSVPLSADGATVTHYGTSTLAKQSGHDEIVALAPQMPGASYFCINSQTGELISTNTEATIGNPWTWQDSLQLLGLQTYVEPEP